MSDAMRGGALAAVLSLALAGCGSTSSPPATTSSAPTRTHAVAPPTAPPTPSRPKPVSPARATAVATPPAPASPNLISHGPRTARRVALTFDADMTRGMLLRLRAGQVRSWYDERIVRLLRATHTPATIFLTGLWTQTYPGVVRSLARDPLFELENHTVDHAGFERPCYGLPTVPSQSDKRVEVVEAARTIARTAGRRPRYFRYPGGCHTAQDDQLVASLGETPVGWDVVSGDPFQPDPSVVVRAVLGGVRPGSIVVMHIIGAPNTPATYSALRAIIPALEARGYRFVTLSELLA